MKHETAQQKAAKPGKVWQPTQYSNLIRYVPSGTFFARLRVAGKLIRQSIKTDVLSMAKLRLCHTSKNPPCFLQQLEEKLCPDKINWTADVL
jgi:hypothetical protein